MLLCFKQLRDDDDGGIGGKREREAGDRFKLLTSQVKVRLGIKRKIDKEKGRIN